MMVRLTLLLMLPATQALAQAGAPDAAPDLAKRLEKIRVEKVAVERAMVVSDKAKRSTEDQLGRLKALQGLQAHEKKLTEKRLRTLEKYLSELQDRKTDVQRRLADSKNAHDNVC
ncbi:hypothetical protein EB061_13090 [bacterium]|nr:hypothetical protein [bacterium]